MLYGMIGLVLGIIVGIIMLATNAFGIIDDIEMSDIEENTFNAILAVLFLGAWTLAWPLCILIVIITAIFSLIKRTRE